jgi:nicotinate-nucleotide pyrophosphorylase (carboxylating)
MPLAPEALALIDAALAEDVGDGDFTTLWTVPAERRAEARIVAKSAGVIAGSAVAAEVFRRVDPALEIDAVLADGTAVERGGLAMAIRGSARSILTAERTALNFMQRLSAWRA